MSGNLTKLIGKKFLWLSLKLWALYFIVSYVFFGVLYLIPELAGKNLNHINFYDLISAVVNSTIFEILGIFASLMIEIESIGRLGSFKISFLACIMFTLACILQVRSWLTCLHILKGCIQIPIRALHIYTAEIYPTEIRGTALGVANVFTRVAGLLTPIANEILLSHGSKFCFVVIFGFCSVATTVVFTLKKETLGTKIE